MDENMDDRFDKEIESAQFSFLEMKGFKVNPKWALKAGMAMGYTLAVADMNKHIQTVTGLNKQP
jgi:hypothetical protein